MHSLPLSVLVELGWPGLILFTAWLCAVLLRTHPRHVAIVPMMVMAVVQIFDDFLYDPTFAVVLLSLLASLVASFDSHRVETAA